LTTNNTKLFFLINLYQEVEYARLEYTGCECEEELKKKYDVDFIEPIFEHEAGAEVSFSYLLASINGSIKLLLHYDDMIGSWPFTGIYFIQHTGATSVTIGNCLSICPPMDQKRIIHVVSRDFRVNIQNDTLLDSFLKNFHLDISIKVLGSWIVLNFKQQKI
jgi:hypothetical protein